MRLRVAACLGLLLTAVCLWALPGLIQSGKPASECGEIEGHFRGRFWHFYLRGNSYAACQMWAEAEADFKEAARQRESDQLMAQTYGLHFIDYFPRRELGIVYFRQGRINEAQSELAKSYEGEPSARAAFYLNEVRRALIGKAGGEKTLPSITIHSPSPDSVLSAFKVTVKGEVRDAGLVQSIEVNGKPVFFELAREVESFEAEVPLERDQKIIRVIAEDLSGNVNVATIPVRIDREGPQVVIEQVSAPRPGFLLVRGTVFDHSGVASFSLGERSLSIRPGSEVSFREEIMAEQGLLSFEATDHIGNRTRGSLEGPDSLPKKGARLSTPIRYASLAFPHQLPAGGPTDLPFYLAAGEGPYIEIKGLREEETVYVDQIVLEGRVVSDQQITELAVQNKPILQRPGQNVYFSTLTPLKKGENSITVAAVDQQGRRSEDRVKIQRVIPKVHDVGTRFSLSLMPLAGSQSGSPQQEIVQSKFLHHLTGLKRFALVERERLESVLSEMRLSQEKLVDPETSIQVGRLVAAGGMVFGEIHQTKDSMEVVARLVDTETGKILFSRDAYTETLDLKSLDGLCERLAWKFHEAYPLVEGTVIKVSGKTLYTDLGKAMGVADDMQIVVFELGEEIIHPVTGESLGADTNELGTAVLTGVQDKFSKAELRPGAKEDKIAVGMMVITR